MDRDKSLERNLGSDFDKDLDRDLDTTFGGGLSYIQGNASVAPPIHVSVAPSTHALSHTSATFSETCQPRSAFIPCWPGGMREAIK